MKCPIILLSLFLFPIFLKSQTTKPSASENFHKGEQELKLNMLELLIMPAVGVTYERFLNEHSSFGLYGFINFGLDEDYRYEKIELAPFYRIYFENKEKANNKGFFTELFSGINLGETEFYDCDDYNCRGNEPLIIQEYLGVSLGLSVGYKFLNYNQYSFEFFAGAGRYLNEQKIRAYPRIGFSIGKRF